jgi:hypothetical protein
MIDNVKMDRSAGSRESTITKFREHGKEALGSRKGGKFIDYVRDYPVWRRVRISPP